MWENSLTYRSRLSYWKTLRSGIKNDESLLLDISKIPHTLYHREVDFYTPSSWPTPWDILEAKVLCRSCVGILLYHTIKIALPDSSPKMMLINNSEEMWLVVEYNNKIYNFVSGSTCTFDELLTSAKVECNIDLSEIKRIS